MCSTTMVIRSIMQKRRLGVQFLIHIFSSAILSAILNSSSLSHFPNVYHRKSVSTDFSENFDILRQLPSLIGTREELSPPTVSHATRQRGDSTGQCCVHPRQSTLFNLALIWTRCLRFNFSFDLLLQWIVEIHILNN